MVKLLNIPCHQKKYNLIYHNLMLFLCILVIKEVYQLFLNIKLIKKLHIYSTFLKISILKKFLINQVYKLLNKLKLNIADQVYPLMLKFISILIKLSLIQFLIIKLIFNLEIVCVSLKLISIVKNSICLIEDQLFKIWNQMLNKKI